jgi:hypothetical protein
VFFAGTRGRLAKLESGVLLCGGRVDDGSANGPGLVVLTVPSVLVAMSLAEWILDLGLIADDEPPGDAGS